METFVTYLKKYKFQWMLILIFNLFCHGSMLLSNSIGIDTEAIISEELAFYEGWLYTGRPGLVFLKYIFDSLCFNPYLTGIGTICFVTLNCILWTYLFCAITGRENLHGIMSFSLLFSAHSILTEYLYFKLLAMEAACCFCIIAVSVYFSHKYALSKKWYYWITAVPLSVVAFGSYQAMNGIYLFGAVACFFLYYYFHVLEKENPVSCKNLWFYILRFSVCFFSGFAINQLITGLYFSGSKYLNSQSHWGKESFRQCLYNIWDHMIRVLKGDRFYFVKSYPAYLILLIVMCGVVLYKYRRKQGKYLGVTVVMLLFLSPFFLTVVCGGETVIRSQLTLPFTLAFMGYILYLFDFPKWKYNRLLQMCFIVLNVFTAYTQMRYTLLLNYTDDVRYQSDVRTATAIMEEIDKRQDEDNAYRVAFIGKRDAELNPSCIYGETIGYSIFDWDTNVEPLGYYSTKRIVGFMNTMGADYTYVTKDEMIAAVDYGVGMSNWPGEGSIQVVGDIIIVKLSDFE